ncbi:MAG: ABC transporter ATP-binding protein [Thermoplasmataceae archaeon]
MKIEAKDLEYLNQSFRLNVDNLFIEEGGITGIGGPNGSGKSTLLKILYGYLRPLQGAVLIDGEDLRQMKSTRVARSISVVQQETPTPMNFTVEDIVSMSRYDTRPDRGRIAESLRLCGIEHLGVRKFEALSGGERRLVMIAGALYQGTDIIMLDEPTTFLDVDKEIRILDLITDLKKLGKTVIVVIHDLNILRRICNRVILLRDGKVVDQGYPSKIFTSETLAKVYGSSFISFSTPEGIVWKPFNRVADREVKILVIEEEFSMYGLAYNIWKTGLLVRRVLVDGDSRGTDALIHEIDSISADTNFVILTRRSLDIMGKGMEELILKFSSRGKLMFIVDYESESNKAIIPDRDLYFRIFGVEKSVTDICREVHEACISLSSPAREDD